VRDTGIGIAADRHEAVFQAFQQADNTTERRYGGTGLGLAISRSLLQAMGRELTLESEVGLGSTFTIQLDAADSGSARPPDTPRLRAV
jgi:signal transduction histidine kinase